MKPFLINKLHVSPIRMPFLERFGAFIFVFSLLLYSPPLLACAAHTVPPPRRGRPRTSWSISRNTHRKKNRPHIHPPRRPRLPKRGPRATLAVPVAHICGRIFTSQRGNTYLLNQEIYLAFIRIGIIRYKPILGVFLHFPVHLPQEQVCTGYVASVLQKQKGRLRVDVVEQNLRDLGDKLATN